MHYYKFNISDWSLSTSHLSLEEEAIYFRLINYYYDTESPIPLETQSVFRRLRLGSKDEIALAILGEFFELTDNGWIHNRCEEILKEYRKTSKKNKSNGAKGGRPSNGAACKETQKKPSGFPEETQHEPKHNPNYKLLTNNHKPITNNQNNIAPPDFINPMAWDEWVKFRREKKKPISKTAAEKQFKFLSDYDFETQKSIVEESIKNDYQGLFPPKGGSHAPIKPTRSTLEIVSGAGRNDW